MDGILSQKLDAYRNTESRNNDFSVSERILCKGKSLVAGLIQFILRFVISSLELRTFTGARIDKWGGRVDELDIGHGSISFYRNIQLHAW